MARTICDHFDVNGGRWRVSIVADRHRGGFSARLIGNGDIHPMMEPNGRTKRDALARLIGDLRHGDNYDRRLARAVVAGARTCEAKRSASHDPFHREAAYQRKK